MRQREIDHAASVAQAAELEVITVQIIFISIASKKTFSAYWELSYRVFYPPQCATNSDAVHSQLQSFEFHLFYIYLLFLYSYSRLYELPSLMEDPFLCLFRLSVNGLTASAWRGRLGKGLLVLSTLVSYYVLVRWEEPQGKG